MRQLYLFPEKLKQVTLYAPDSPRRAVYRIWIEKYNDRYRVCKESGYENKILDRREWAFDAYEAAYAYFLAKIRSKTDSNRNSPRRYQIVGQPNLN